MRYIVRRLLILPASLIFVTFACYVGLRSIGSARDIAIGILNFNYTEANAQRLIEELKLDRSIPRGYAEWLWGAIRLDFGTSFIARAPVKDLLLPTLPVTFQLMVMATILCLVISIPLAVLSAYRPGSRFDRFVSAGAFGFLSLPEYVFGVGMLFFVALGTRVGGITIIPSGIFPAGNHVPITENPFQSIRHLFLPALTVAISQSANFMRILRTDMLATLQEDFVLLAKSKGLSDRVILLRHALRPSSFTLVTITGLSIGSLIGTSTIVEQLFTLNGTGSALLRGVYTRDMPMVLGAVTIITLVYVVTTAAVDVLYGVIDPGSGGCASSCEPRRGPRSRYHPLMAPAEPNWYPDPSRRHELRFWDGTTWTPHVSDAGTVSLDDASDAMGVGTIVAGTTPAEAVREQVHGTGMRGAGLPAGDPTVAPARGGTLFDEPVLVVNQKAKLIELTNQYAVYNGTGTQIGSVSQVGQSAAKKVLRALTSLDQFMTTRLEVTDMAGTVLLALTRPRKVFKSTVVVERPGVGEVGRIVQENMIGKIHFALQAGGATVGAIRAENWRAWNFRIEDALGNEVARITKTWEGMAKTLFTTADNYVVHLHGHIDEPLRSLVVASALSVDTALKQDSRGLG